ncbi:TraB/GumN family protein [Croceicoccus sp. YJ47]|uniref:TraB/GumN family protein n=1 Tax=Croceicoccus sp. YJ47 TaxID=2798724 RepID=UPI0019216BF5|nr:TraB/GumN family protein [Croceicoccus sp. YJ47]QQN74062.1 TraB/GumN family protein [Croceicoccus sp. YJ47]
MTIPATGRWRAWLCALLLCALSSTLAACGGPRVEANPALWRIEDEAGRTAGWLFGTVHALPADVDWRREGLKRVIADAGMLVVEVRALDDTAAIAGAMAALGRTEGLPPLSRRIPARDRPALAALFERADIEPGAFRDVETWAAALSVSSALSREAGNDSGAGTDRALLDAFDGRPVAGLETAGEQLAIFDRLDEDAQLALLRSMWEAPDDDGAMLDAWMRGDAATLTRILEQGLAADADLRTALLVNRNRRWITQIEPLLSDGRRPLIAVGAGHMGGADGLIAMLRARGWRVVRAD